MHKFCVKVVLGAVSMALISLVGFSQAEGRGFWRGVDCNKKGQSIQKRLDWAWDGAVIEVSGNCVENITIKKNRITLRAVNGATLTGADDTEPTIRVQGLNTRIENFADGFIRGGSHVIMVQRGASVAIENNVISNGTGMGVLVHQSAYASIRQNHIHSNGSHGVYIRQSASAGIHDNRIGGVNALGESLGNRLRGIQVSDSAEADIDDNDITHNGSDGIRVRRGSHVRLSGSSSFGGANLIENNGRRGIRCQTNSSVRFDAVQDFGSGNGGADTDFQDTCVLDQ